MRTSWTYKSIKKHSTKAAAHQCLILHLIVEVAQWSWLLLMGFDIFQAGCNDSSQEGGGLVAQYNRTSSFKLVHYNSSASLSSGISSPSI